MLFPDWVAFMLFGTPYGGFNLNTEPAHDYATVRTLKEGMDRDDFRRIDWDFVRASITAE